jgi:chlorobactene glucosyltransferase
MPYLEMLLGASFCLWLGLAIFWLWNLGAFSMLTPATAARGAVQNPAPWPKVSILVPARNEEAALPRCLESLAKLDYADYEVIVVDDDSSDRTGAIADQWARRPEFAGRMEVIHNRELPAGWSGKVHALHLAAGLATGEWILATDADMIFHPAVVRVAVERAMAERADLLSLTPEFELGSFWEKVVLPAFAFLLATLFPLRRVNSPRSARALAAGAFILMRAREVSHLDAYSRLCSTVVEDLRIAELFKQNGRRIFLVPTRGLLRTRMYSGCRELFEGLSRSAFEGVGFSPFKIVAGVVVGLLASVVPWAAALILGLLHATRPLSSEDHRMLILSLATCVLSSLIYLPVVFFMRLSPLYVFTLPLAAVFYSAVATHSMARSLAGPGISWKERHYRPPS